MADFLIFSNIDVLDWAVRCCGRCPLCRIFSNVPVFPVNRMPVCSPHPSCANQKCLQTDVRSMFFGCAGDILPESFAFCAVLQELSSVALPYLSFFLLFSINNLPLSVNSFYPWFIELFYTHLSLDKDRKIILFFFKDLLYTF